MILYDLLKDKYLFGGILSAAGGFSMIFDYNAEDKTIPLIPAILSFIGLAAIFGSGIFADRKRDHHFKIVRKRSIVLWFCVFIMFCALTLFNKITFEDLIGIYYIVVGTYAIFIALWMYLQCRKERRKSRFQKNNIQTEQ